MPTDAKQRFVALKVNEVSIVDRGANDEVYLTIKSLNGGAAMTRNAEANTPPAGSVTVEKHLLDGINATMTAIEKAAAAKPEYTTEMKGAMGKLHGMLGEMMAKKEGETTPAATTTASTEKRHAQFTPERQAALKGVLSSLQDILKDLDGNEAPAATTTAAAPTTDGAVAKALEAVNTRLAAVEKSLVTTKGAAEPAGEGAPATVQKSFWGGVL